MIYIIFILINNSASQNDFVYVCSETYLEDKWIQTMPSKSLPQHKIIALSMNLSSVCKDECLTLVKVNLLSM